MVYKKRKVSYTMEIIYFLKATLNKTQEELKKENLNGKNIQELLNELQESNVRLNNYQMAVLRARVFLTSLLEEKKNLQEEYGIEIEDLLKIFASYEKIEDFISDYKSGKCKENYKIKSGGFVGARCVTISKKSITVKQKLSYIKFAKDLLYLAYNQEITEDKLGFYIDINVLEEALKEIQESDDAKIIKQRYGIDDGIIKTAQEIARNNGISSKTADNIKERVFKKLKIIIDNRKKKLWVEYKDISIINNKLAEILDEENRIEKIENFVLTYIKMYSDKVEKKFTWKELEIWLNNQDIQQLQIKHSKNNEISLRDLMNFCMYTLKQYYSKFRNKLYEKEKLNSQKKYYEKTNEIYIEAEKEFLKNEKIFDPNYEIKGNKIESPILNEDFPIKKTITELPISIEAIILLHREKIETLSDLVSNYENDIDGIKRYINSILGSNNKDAKKLFNYIIDNGYINNRNIENEEKIEFARKIKLCIKSKKITELFKTAKINDLGDLLDYDWKKFKNIKGIREIGKQEIYKELENQGLTNYIDFEDNGIHITCQLKKDMTLVEEYKMKNCLKPIIAIDISSISSENYIDIYDDKISLQARKEFSNEGINIIGDFFEVYFNKKNKNHINSNVKKTINILKNLGFVTHEGLPITQINIININFRETTMDFLSKQGIKKLGDLFKLYDQECENWDKLKDTGISEETFEDIMSTLKEHNLVYIGNNIEKTEIEKYVIKNEIRRLIEILKSYKEINYKSK